MEIKNSKITLDKGLFATKKYKLGEIVHVLDGKIFDYPTRETIHIGNNKHIYDEYGIFINHSFNPNIIIDKNKMIALKDIDIDEELSFNYNDSEINMANKFYVNGVLVCGCKTTNDPNVQ